MTSLDVDVLIVGAGVAALSAALEVTGREVTILYPEHPLDVAASALAQGGIAAATSAQDSWVQHYLDTIRVGDHAVSPWAAFALARQARPAVEFLCEHGVQFDRCDGEWVLSREAGHSSARVLCVEGDRTGAALLQALLRSAQTRNNVKLLGGVTATRLISDSEGIAGVSGVDRAGREWTICARDTVLATGGLGHLFRHTTNPRHAWGDGLAMALAARARCAALEFVQFHPTALHVAADPLPLVTEALRGAGAIIVNDRGERFLRNVHPDCELAPRDVLARAIWAQIQAGRTVYLDATKAVGEQIVTRFPTVHAHCRRFGIDPAHEPIPVIPAAHFHMGGVIVDMHGRSSLARLWACGEVAFTGVHGANRLASNSLLEAVVFGRRTGRELSGSAGARPHIAAGSHPAEDSMPQEDSHAALEALRETMWKHLGIVRSEEGLSEGVRTLTELERRVRGSGVLTRRVLLARAMFQAALERNESRGAHFRADHPQREPALDGPLAVPRRA